MLTGNSADGFNQQASGATSISSTGINVTGSATGLIIPVVWQSSTANVSNIAGTWNGVSLTLGPSRNVSAGARFVTSAILILPLPASGAKTLALTWTTAADCYMSAVSLTGTDTSTVTNASDNVTASATTSITVTSDTSGATVAVFGVDGGTPTVNFTKIFAEAPLNPGGGANFTLGGTSNVHTFTGGGGTIQTLSGVHVIAGGGGGGRTFRVPTGLDGISSSGPKQFNPSLGYHHAPQITLEAYWRGQAQKHRDFMAKVERAA